MSDSTAQKTIFDIFPEISRIQDEDLKQVVVSAWNEYLEQYGYDAIIALPFSGFAADVTLVEHVSCVAEIAMSMADVFAARMNSKVNKDLLLAAVLLHDLGKAYEYEFVDGAWRKTDIGKKFMHGFWGTYRSLNNGASVDLAHLISTHTPISPVHTQLVEGVILHYADLAHADMICMERGIELYLSK